MSGLSHYLDILRQTGADEVRLVPREPVAVIMAGRRPTVGGSPVSTRALTAVVDALLTQEQQRELASRAQTVAHEDGDDHFSIEISRQGNELVVSLRRAARPTGSTPRAPIPIPVRTDRGSEPIRVMPNHGSEPIRVAPERVEPIRAAPERIAPERVEPIRAAPERIEPIRVAPERVEPIRLADRPTSRTPTRPDVPAVVDPLPPAEPVPRATREATPRSTPQVHQPRGPQRIDELLREMLAKHASDLHLTADNHPVLRVHGEIVQLTGRPRLSSAEIHALVAPIMPERAQQDFASNRDADCAYEVPGLARFRVNVFEDRRGTGAVLRQIPIEIISAEQLGLPRACTDLCQLSKGLVVVTGPTGSGKSTTLAAMIDRINRTRTDHIITIEDPIEFVHPNHKCLINQREVGTHTKGFKQALRAALREDPDVVLVGEMRDLETIAIAIETAETGHLVFGTLHTTTATSTVDRIIDQFPADRQAQIRVMLSESLKGVVAQVLCKKIGGGRVAAHEVLLATPAVSALVRDGKTFQLHNVMQTSKALGMVTMNDALFALVQRQLIEPREAWLKAVDKPGIVAMLKQAGLPTEFGA